MAVGFLLIIAIGLPPFVRISRLEAASSASPLAFASAGSGSSEEGK